MADFNLKQGTAKTWINSGGDYGITFASVADNAARQGAKGDLGASFAEEWGVLFAIETGSVAPSAGEAYELWWAGSPNTTAGTDNPGGASGTDSAYKAGEVDEWKKQLMFVGALSCTNDANTIQTQMLSFSPKFRYGMPVIVNKSGQTANSSNTNHRAVFYPLPVTDA